MRIEKIQPSQRVKGRFLLYLDNGEIVRVGEGEMISFALYAGMEVSAADLNALQQAAAVSKLKERAFSIVSRKPISRGELVDSLSRPKWKKGEQPPSAEELEWLAAAAVQVADRLEELGLINDREYAKTIVSHYGKKGYGVRRLRDELYQHKVPREYWDEALATAQPPDDSVDSFLQKRLKGEIPDQKELQRVSAALARRGFGWEEIKEGIERYRNEVEQ